MYNGIVDIIGVFCCFSRCWALSCNLLNGERYFALESCPTALGELDCPNLQLRTRTIAELLLYAASYWCWRRLRVSLGVYYHW